jgi:hypothetical protein
LELNRIDNVEMELVEDNLSQFLSSIKNNQTIPNQLSIECIKNSCSLWKTQQNLNTAKTLLKWFSIKEVDALLGYCHNIVFRTRYLKLKKELTSYVANVATPCYGCDFSGSPGEPKFVNLFCPTHGRQYGKRNLSKTS